jgi:hypothetical protein
VPGDRGHYRSSIDLMGFFDAEDVKSQVLTGCGKRRVVRNIHSWDMVNWKYNVSLSCCGGLKLHDGHSFGAFSAGC